LLLLEGKTDPNAFCFEFSNINNIKNKCPIFAQSKNYYLFNK